MLDDTKQVIKPEKGILSETVSISELVEQSVGFVLRQFPTFLFIPAATIAIALVYLFTTPAMYTAHALLLIDSSKANPLQLLQGALNDIPMDTAQIETQVELLKSEKIGLAVIKQARLTEDPEFVGSAGRGITGTIFGLVHGIFGSANPKTPEAAPGASELIVISEEKLARNALGVFLAGRTITRVGRTYVLDIGFTSLNPSRAAGVANAIADAYIEDQLESKYQTTRRASGWMQERIKELRIQTMAADRAVLDFKEKNKIIDTGGSNITGTGGRPLVEQQIVEVTAQLSAARAASAEAKARLERIEQVRKRDLPEATIADQLRSEVITRLRNQYLDLSAREAIWSNRYGSNHLAAVNLRNQMAELKRSISDELDRIAQSYQSEYEIAQAREKTLTQNLASQVSVGQIVSRERLGLGELESQAQVYRTLYDTFLQRFTETTQQQSFPTTEARLIAAASPPSGRSSPRTSFVLGVAGLLGLTIGFGLAILREAVDRVFRTPRQVETILHMNCLAVLPLLKYSPSLVVKSDAGLNKRGNREATEQERTSLVTDRALRISRYRQVINEPLSSFTEAFRSIKVAIDIERVVKQNKVIGITSTTPKEGKSTIAANLAQLMAHTGKRVILVDGDLRNPTLSRRLSPDASRGILQVLAGEVELRQAIDVDKETGLHFLPTIFETRLAHTSEILASETFKKLIDGFRQSYDYIVIDLSPLSPVVDVRATANVVDSYVFVIEWGKTGVDLVQHQLASAPEIYESLLGVVLNKVNIKRLQRYEYYHGSYYEHKYYANYGYTE
jgi:exopolysaccharide transport family protein